jgi:RNA-directed DNA polymerase
MGRRTVRQRALCLPSKAVHTRVKRRERTPHGEGPELSETSDAKVIDCISGRSVPVNVDEMQKKLSQKATKEPEHHFENLYGLRCHEVWLRVAAHTVLQNKGSGTAGIDGMTKSHFLGDPDGYIRSLQASLKAKTFEPAPVKRVYIPKPNSEKKRPLGVPILLDRIVQEALRMILEPIWEADFSTHSYGFRPNRSTYDAMTYIGKRLASSAGQAYQWVIEGDIASYLDRTS